MPMLQLLWRLLRLLIFIISFFLSRQHWCLLLPLLLPLQLLLLRST
jgi:hypothetical protein